MKFPGHGVIAAWAVGCLLVATAAGTFAGGLDDHDDDVNTLRYFGFVKDANGRMVPGARVSAALKGSMTFSTTTDSTGAYRIPVLRILPGVSPENIRISCAKEGYKQLRTLVRSALNKKPLVAVEVECVLQGAAVK
jgi:hypothetical protein